MLCVCFLTNETSHLVNFLTFWITQVSRCIVSLMGVSLVWVQPTTSMFMYFKRNVYLKINALKGPSKYCKTNLTLSCSRTSENMTAVKVPDDVEWAETKSRLSWLTVWEIGTNGKDSTGHQWPKWMIMIALCGAGSSNRWQENPRPHGSHTNSRPNWSKALPNHQGWKLHLGTDEYIQLCAVTICNYVIWLDSKVRITPDGLATANVIAATMEINAWRW